MPEFDPQAPLPEAPDPWASSTMPELRDGPPYAMTEMIAAEPALAERLANRLSAGPGGARRAAAPAPPERLANRPSADPGAARLAADLRGAAESGAPIIVTGCGTSEHA